MKCTALTIPVCGVVVLLLGVTATPACDLKVRDAAFRTPRDVHQLCVIAQSSDENAAATAGRLGEWIEGPGKGLNLELVRVNAEDPEIDWPSYGIPSVPPELPVVVLVGRNYGNGESFYIQHWQPAPSEQDLAALSDSPVRERIRQEVGQRMAVVLYVPASAGEEESAQPLLERIAEKWSSPGPLGVSVIELDRADPQEQLLLSFAGVGPQGPDWLGVVFGRGKLMGPPLVDENMAEASLDELIEQVTAECSCSKPLPQLGVDIPLVWNEKYDAAEVVLAEADTSAELDVPLPGLSASLPPDQTASPLERDQDYNASLSPGDRLDSSNNTLLATALWTLAVLFVVITTVSICIVWWKKRSHAGI
jgi:hypothetical protein